MMTLFILGEAIGYILSIPLIIIAIHMGLKMLKEATSEDPEQKQEE